VTSHQPPQKKHQTLWILDFGSQTTQLISGCRCSASATACSSLAHSSAGGHVKRGTDREFGPANASR
jgi:GMP synthase-like glutamine amidotransferase